LFQSIAFGFDEVPQFDFVHFHAHVERNLQQVVKGVTEGKGVVIRGPKGTNKSTTMKYFALILGRYVANFDLHANSGIGTISEALSLLRGPTDFVCFRMPPSSGLDSAGGTDVFEQLANYRDKEFQK
jgi:ATPase subunit of ABC transporter with duplicated ATPase domains